MPAIIPIDTTITAIDHDLFGMPGIGVTYVVRGDADQVALIDTGTSPTAPATLAALEQLGIRARRFARSSAPTFIWTISAAHSRSPLRCPTPGSISTAQPPA